ncbi:YggS family pyridoxal phosphate-dependent enzyme [Paenibacillus albicereus]|uniref:Pyridoxal phosphate homeostasis protein n=1 Tax=Paenibacillus albicereus TaxID=2726185 RepID=A0A6H2GYK1_9BACL|nr:YggS family pyridoxal phosphate-dependent enzyme [Paenibacillus albicereus]QJC52485.1 YggS family pyridoxal phosphate-dependent enzyme [Paenibacillus albicereus]
MSLQERKAEVDRRIAEACRRAGRDPREVGVIAVTKYVSLERTREALAAGCRQLGENRWQDARAKWEALAEEYGAERAGTGPEWHFIGSLQTNKAKDVVGKFTYIHSLDRLSLAEAIDRKAASLGIEVPCFIQVNVSGEASKHGLEPAGLEELARGLRDYPRVRPIGLMTMAPHEEEPEATRPVFRRLRELRDEANAREWFMEPLAELSMGMSNDFEIAIEEGATRVRLGTVLVGHEEERV